MPIEVASSCEIISRNCSQFLSFLSLCVGRRWWNFENAHKITNKYEQQTIIHHHTYPCTHGCNMLDVATTSARMLGSSENIRDRIQATYNNLYMLSHWRHLKIFEVLLCLSLSLSEQKGCMESVKHKREIAQPEEGTCPLRVHFCSNLSLSPRCVGRFSIHVYHNNMYKHAWTKSQASNNWTGSSSWDSQCHNV